MVEKILEHGENLPQFFAADGTTGYEVLADDRPGAHRSRRARQALDALDARLRERSGLPSALPWPELIAGTKRAIGDRILRSEVRRLTRDLRRARSTP